MIYGRKTKAEMTMHYQGPMGWGVTHQFWPEGRTFSQFHIRRDVAGHHQHGRVLVGRSGGSLSNRHNGPLASHTRVPHMAHKCYSAWCIPPPSPTQKKKKKELKLELQWVKSSNTSTTTQNPDARKTRAEYYWKYGSKRFHRQNLQNQEKLTEHEM